MIWKKIVSKQESSIFRGTLLKFPASYPFESEVVMMLCELRIGDRQYGLVTITGYNAGINPFVAFPNECMLDDKSIAFSRDWLIQNWTKWVWPEGDINDVLFCERLDVHDLK
jgi:hypothetical protein